MTISELIIHIRTNSQHILNAFISYCEFCVNSIASMLAWAYSSIRSWLDEVELRNIGEEGGEVGPISQRLGYKSERLVTHYQRNTSIINRRSQSIHEYTYQHLSSPLIYILLKFEDGQPFYTIPMTPAYINHFVNYASKLKGEPINEIAEVRIPDRQVVNETNAASWPQQLTIGHMIIGESVHLQEKCFKNFPIKNLTIMDLVNIDEYAFANTSMLEKVSIGNHVNVGIAAFAESGVKYVKAGNGNKFAMLAFTDCHRLEEFTAQQSNNLTQMAIFFNSSLNRFSIGSMSSIQLHAFRDCNDLRNVCVSGEIKCPGKYGLEYPAVEPYTGFLLHIDNADTFEFNESSFSNDVNTRIVYNQGQFRPQRGILRDHLSVVNYSEHFSRIGVNPHFSPTDAQIVYLFTSNNLNDNNFMLFMLSRFTTSNVITTLNRANHQRCIAAPQQLSRVPDRLTSEFSNLFPRLRVDGYMVVQTIMDFLTVAEVINACDTTFAELDGVATNPATSGEIISEHPRVEVLSDDEDAVATNDLSRSGHQPS